MLKTTKWPINSRNDVDTMKTKRLFHEWTIKVVDSVTRLGDFLRFGLLFKAFSIN